METMLVDSHTNFEGYQVELTDGKRSVAMLDDVFGCFGVRIRFRGTNKDFCLDLEE